jgi:hypothetical protein
MQFIKNNPNRSRSPSTEIWDQWLAGLIDGDGCFFISKEGQISCEITVALADERLLQEVKNVIQGVLKLRSGSQSIRLRIFRKPDFINLVHRVNGHIRLASRHQQFKKVCEKFDIPCLNIVDLHPTSGYMAGFFDADGSVTLTVNKSKTESSIMSGNHGKYIRLSQGGVYCQLSLHIVSKDANVLYEVQNAFGFGKILVEKASLSNKRPNVLYRWYFRNQDDVASWLAYIKKAPLRSVKKKRCFLLPNYFTLKAAKAHLSKQGEVSNQLWDIFCRQWFGIY